MHNDIVLDGKDENDFLATGKATTWQMASREIGEIVPVFLCEKLSTVRGRVTSCVLAPGGSVRLWRIEFVSA